MNQTFARFSMLVGDDGIEILKNSNVIVFGIGGVGSYIVESFARSGVGNITMVDFDEISESNINRQLHSLHSTIGQSKIEVMKDRVLDINPECNVKPNLVPDKSDIFKYELPTEFRENNDIPRKITPGSNAFVPGTAGFVISAYVIRKLLNME